MTETKANTNAHIRDILWMPTGIGYTCSADSYVNNVYSRSQDIPCDSISKFIKEDLYKGLSSKKQEDDESIAKKTDTYFDRGLRGTKDIGGYGHLYLRDFILQEFCQKYYPELKNSSVMEISCSERE